MTQQSTSCFREKLVFSLVFFFLLPIYKAVFVSASLELASTTQYGPVPEAAGRGIDMAGVAHRHKQTLDFEGFDNQT